MNQRVESEAPTTASDETISPQFRVDDLGMTEVVLKDFQNSWEYYKFNLEKRREIVARIYNFVGFPIFAIALMLYYIDNKLILFTNQNQQGPDPSFISYGAGCLALFLLATYGWFQIIALAIESRVSRNYLDFLNNVRHFVGVKSPALRPFLKFNAYETQIRMLLTDPSFESIRQSNLDQHVIAQLEAIPKKEAKIPWYVRRLIKIKGAYWRSASAILIVSVAQGGATALLGKYMFPSYFVGSLYMMAVGMIIALTCFVTASRLFNVIIEN